MNWLHVQALFQKLWIWLCRQWLEGAEIQRRIDAERSKIQERYDSSFHGHWL